MEYGAWTEWTLILKNWSKTLLVQTPKNTASVLLQIRRILNVQGMRGEDMPKGRRCFFAGIPVPRLKGLPYIEITSESKCTRRHAWRMIMPSHRRPVAKRLLCSSNPPPQFQARWRVQLRHTGGAASSCKTRRAHLHISSCPLSLVLPFVSRPAATCNMGNVPLPLVQAPSLCASHLQPNARSQDSTMAGRGTLRARALSLWAAAISHRSTLAACPT